jgi:hypothetical protein
MAAKGLIVASLSVCNSEVGLEIEKREKREETDDLS